MITTVTGTLSNIPITPQMAPHTANVKKTTNVLMFSRFPIILGSMVAAVDGSLEPEPVAEACLQAIRDETFLVLPHPEVLTYMRRKTDDYDRWIKGMQRLNAKYS